MFDAILLEPEQQGLLATLVEAARNVPRDRRQRFAIVWTGQGPDFLFHPGLSAGESGGVEVYLGDVDTLVCWLFSPSRAGSWHP